MEENNILGRKRRREEPKTQSSKEKNVQQVQPNNVPELSDPKIISLEEETPSMK